MADETRDQYGVRITYPGWDGMTETFARDDLADAQRVAAWHRNRGGQATVLHRQIIVTDWQPVVGEGDRG